MISGSIFGDFPAGSQLAEKAIRMQELLHSKGVEAITTCRAHILVFHHTSPLHESIAPLRASYKNAMRVGDTETASLSLCSETSFPFMLGKNLERLEESCHLTLKQVSQMRTTASVTYLRMMLQAIHNWTGQSENTVVLKGDIVDEDDLLLPSPIDVALFHYIKSYLFAVFGSFERGAELAIQKTDEFAKASPGNAAAVHDTFLRGIPLFAMARRTKQAKYKNHAKKILKTVKGWISKGNPNVKHYVSLFQAEQSALDKKYDAAENLFREAIRVAGRGGYVQDAAIANERYADFLQSISDEIAARERIEQAIRFYKSWGAHRKVAMLQQCYDIEPSVPLEIGLGSSIDFRS
mmetsp:Transcript_172/g.590  ORF Transcript_172/g.590 Transcript_172/m.590 type:complete len:351 (+) Transcript_172:2-1054(+)